MRIHKDNPESHELSVLATNGRVFRFKVVEINALFLSRYFLIALASFCMVFVLIDPKVFQKAAGLPVRLLFWYVNGFLAVALWYGLFRLLVVIRAKTGRDIPVPSALMILVTVSGLLVANYGLFMSTIHPDQPVFGPMLYWDIVRYVGITILFETNVAIFLLPRFFAERSRAENPGVSGEHPSEEPVTVAAGFSLNLDGRNVTLDDVLYLKAAEHYVEVVLHDATELVRASLKDLIDMLAPPDGVQPHRSYWVNRDAIIGMNRVNGAQFIVVHNGDEIPVSRQRRREVSDWLDQHVRKKRPG